MNDCCPGWAARCGWYTAPVVRRVLRWANHLTRGKRDFRQTLAEFIEGGTIGPIPSGR